MHSYKRNLLPNFNYHFDGKNIFNKWARARCLYFVFTFTLSKFCVTQNFQCIVFAENYFWFLVLFVPFYRLFMYFFFFCFRFSKKVECLQQKWNSMKNHFWFYTVTCTGFQFKYRSLALSLTQHKKLCIVFDSDIVGWSASITLKKGTTKKPFWNFICLKR